MWGLNAVSAHWVSRLSVMCTFPPRLNCGVSGGAIGGTSDGTSGVGSGCVLYFSKDSGIFKFSAPL